MPTVTANGIQIEYETHGDPSGQPLLLVMGLGVQLIHWDDALVSALVDRGFYVIRHDNRDVGLSTWFDSAGVPDLAAALTGSPSAAYLIEDMAADAAGVLDALGIGSAHVAGASMGGMIAQALAIGHPTKVRSLVSIMSTTGDRAVGQAHPEAMAALTVAPPATREAALDQAVAASKVIGSPGFEFDEARIRAKAGAAYDRAFHPAGTLRQLVAIIASPDRTPGLKGVGVPTLVIHGEADPLVDPSGGRATAAAVPGATLWMVPGMGHDLPPALFDQVADRIAGHCLRT